MGFNDYPRDMYGGHRYLDYTRLSSITINNSHQNQAFTNAQATTSGNDARSYPDCTIDATIGARSITQCVSLLYDAATQKIGENPYYVLDPLLSRLYFQNNGTAFNFLGNGGNMSIDMRLVLLPYQLAANYYVSCIELRVTTATPPLTVRRIMPVALKPNSIQLITNTGTVVSAINNQPIANSTNTNTTNLPYMACSWFITPNPPTPLATQRLACREIYRIVRLTSLTFEPHGLPGGYEPVPLTFNPITPASIRKPSTTLTETFDYLNSSTSPGLQCPNPNITRSTAFYVNTTNSTTISPYDSRSGAVVQTPGSGTVIHTNWDLEQGANYLTSANLNFESIRVQLNGINA